METVEKDEIPPLFAGATHRLVAGGAPVKVVQWAKDGDHELVTRYPVEGREYKGLLVVDDKHRFALRFGDFIIEDAEGRIWVEASLSTLKYQPAEKGDA